MEIRQLQTFKKVVELEGMTRAAEEMGYAQSSVTAQIKALEDELGVPLFDRVGKKIILTVAGEQLLRYANQLLQIHDEAKSVLRSSGEPSGKLVIGAPESLAAFRLPPVIQEYRSRFPHVKIVLQPGVCWVMRRMVSEGELDISFLMETDQHGEEKDLVIHELVKEPLVIVAPIDHPLASVEKVTVDHLRTETFLHTETGCSYRTMFEHYLCSHGVKVDQSYEFWSLEAIKNCISAGLGIGLLPRVTVHQEIQEGKLVCLNWNEQPYPISTKLCYHSNRWISPALQEWIKLVKEYSVRWRKDSERAHGG
ncbi:LysR family transcriptional regulator [Hazenella coriacea]|uniref:DNA-binding transcriptional LysR family regulator n=1 Tax=Hazenella coriacea TaxID=1179467 RepID=A0A4R3LAZ1_9BACL|nr:LysR family transcriptional regulator [Hazenella coriacea]TCS96438.1 DNA-binding transcriptional LysR family regulator [Hazenella coriacea]